MTQTATQRPLRIVFGALFGLAGHALVALAALVAGRITHPVAGNEFGDLASIALVLLLGEVVVGLGMLVTGIVLVVRGSRDLGLALIGGWLVGLIVAVRLLRS